MSRVRWALAAVLAVVGLFAAVSALRTYAEHGLALGIAAVVVLAVITVAGMASLGLARRRIHVELAGMAAKAPTGTLYEERRQRLEAIKASGARPDLRALAEASAAKEASRAYFGRYLVATTVLVGLVGTFAGLMETLGKVAPLLADDGAGKALSLLAAPLSGLHVTFGASLVAIVVTLALSLAQGDLVLHEEQALATLEDLTHHQLVPALWPLERDANERTVRVLEGLHTEIAQAVAGALKQATEALNKSQDERMTALAKELSVGALQMADVVGTHTKQTSAELSKTAVKVEAQLQGLTDTVAKTLAEATRQQAQHLDGTVTKVAAGLVKNADEVVASLAQRLEASAAAATKHAEDSALQSAMVAEQMTEHLQKVVATAQAHLAQAAQANADLASRLLANAEKERQALSRDVSTSVASLVESVTTSAQTSVERTGAAVAEAAKALSDTLAPLFLAESSERKVLASSLAQNLEELHALVRRADDVSGALGAQAQNTSAALAATGQKVVDALSAATVAQAEGLTLSSERSAERMARATEEASAALATVAERVALALGQTSNEATARLSQAEERFNGTLSTLASTLSANLEQTSQGVMGALNANTQSTKTLLEETSRSVLAAVASNTIATHAHLEQTGRNISEGFATLASRTETALAETNRVLSESAATMITQASGSLVEASHSVIESLGSMAARTESLLSGLGQQTASAVDSAVRGHAETLHATASSLVSGLGDAMLVSGDRLEKAAGKLVDATRTMHATLEPLQPRLDALAGELERLTHEVAVMSAHADSAHGSAVVMAELERMGDGLERLASLVRLAREPHAPEMEEAHS